MLKKPGLQQHSAEKHPKHLPPMGADLSHLYNDGKQDFLTGMSELHRHWKHAAIQPHITHLPVKKSTRSRNL